MSESPGALSCPSQRIGKTTNRVGTQKHTHHQNPCKPFKTICSLLSSPGMHFFRGKGGKAGKGGPLSRGAAGACGCACGCPGCPSGCPGGCTGGSAGWSGGASASTASAPSAAGSAAFGSSGVPNAPAAPWSRECLSKP